MMHLNLCFCVSLVEDEAARVEAPGVVGFEVLGGGTIGTPDLMISSL